MKKYISIPKPIGLSPSVEVVKRLLDEKADVNTSNSDQTPLVALLKKHQWTNLEVVKLLLENHADPNVFKEGKQQVNRSWEEVPPIENPLSLALYSYSHHRLTFVKLLLNYRAKVNWKSTQGFMTALTPFFMSLTGQLADQTIHNLSILVELLKKGAGSLPTLFNEYDALIVRTYPLYRKYSYLAVLGYFFLIQIQQLRSRSVSGILNSYFPSVIAPIIFSYNYNQEDCINYFEIAIERLYVCINTNCLTGDFMCPSDEKPEAWQYPEYPLSLAAYTAFSAMQPLIEAKADVTFIDENSSLTPLDYAVKRNPDMTRDNIGDTAFEKDMYESRFERVKIITNALRDCYKQTLLYEARRISEVQQTSSVSKLSLLE